MSPDPFVLIGALVAIAVTIIICAKRSRSIATEAECRGYRQGVQDTEAYNRAKITGRGVAALLGGRVTPFRFRPLNLPEPNPGQPPTSKQPKLL